MCSVCFHREIKKNKKKKQEVTDKELFFVIVVFFVVFFFHSKSIITRFWLSCKYSSNIHVSWPPSRKYSCCMHGRFHNRSPGVSIMRLESRVIPLCQLFPCHLVPPMSRLSINLSVKGWLYCTIGAFHVSIPADLLSFRRELQKVLIFFF